MVHGSGGLANAGENYLVGRTQCLLVGSQYKLNAETVECTLYGKYISGVISYYCYHESCPIEYNGSVRLQSTHQLNTTVLLL